MSPSHSRLLTRKADDRALVDPPYCLNAIERWILFTALTRSNDEFFSLPLILVTRTVIERCDYKCESAYEETQISKNTTIHDLPDRTALPEQLQHHCHEQHTLTRAHNLLNRHEQWLHELRVISKYKQIENSDVCDVKTLDSKETH